MARQGVCRDFAHLTAALLRANGVPARVVSVYAPGLEPMDFHAVAEALVVGRWLVDDPTLLELRHLAVTAVADPSLPDDDVTDMVHRR